MRQKARYKLDADYRKALLGEPMKLIEHVVRNDRPFTEIVTADYIMVTPFTARGYGIFEEVKEKFKNANDPFEYIPVKLKALKGRSKATDQDSATGDFPHAGLLSTFQYLRRYPTTETNRNRLRARMFYLHFLGVDALELAARVADAAAVTAKYPNPTMQASECVVCHKTIDPVAGLFQDYYSFDGVYGRRKGGWYTDMFAAGFEGEKMAPNSAGERCSGSANGLRMTPASPWPWLSMFTTSSRGAKFCWHRRTWTTLFTPPSAGPIRNNAARSRRSRSASPSRVSTSKPLSKTGSLSDFYRADAPTTALDQPCAPDGAG